MAVGLLFLSLAVTFWRQSTPYAATSNTRTDSKLEALASRFGDRDPSSSNPATPPTSTCWHSDAHIYARNVLMLNTPRPPKQEFDAFMSWARNRYDNIFFFGGGGMIC